MKINTHLKPIILYSLGLLSTKLISLIMLPLVTSFLKPQDFGSLEILQTLISLLSVVFSFGVVDALFRYGVE